MDNHPSASRPDVIRVSAQIIQASAIPSPKLSDYADCLYTAEVKILEIRSDLRVPREIVLVLPAFTKRTFTSEAAFKEGQVIDAEIIPHEKAGERLKTMQRSDTLTRFDLQVYDSLSAKVSTRAPESFVARPDSYFQGVAENTGIKKTPPAAAPVRYPWSAKAALDRQAVIARDKATILKAYADNGSDWVKWYESRYDLYEDIDAQILASNSGELLKGRLQCGRFVHGKYRLLCEAGEAGEQGPLKMLSSLNAQLRARGIDLIVVPFPAKEDVHAEVFSSKASADGWFQPYRQKFFLQLLEADIEVIDLIQPLRAARNRFPFVFYDEIDQHPADGGIQVAAEEVARRLARYDLNESAPDLKLQLKPVKVEKTSDRGTASYPATQVASEDGTSLEVPLNSGSPVIIMGDSYTRIPHQYLPGGNGCAIPMHLAHRLGVLPDHLVRMGSSAQAMHLLAREGGNYLANRRVLVFIFANNRLFGTVARNVQHKDDDWNMLELPPLRLDK
jgi:hypothetical protein